ncbi:unnamed protein product (macronuclear) [Paramecium tetraurelia]|uniref:Uncharacterized protein n=1 Tax=Paramecium tetraurelia TaxID=5888 RepID=A0BDD4_PARTE|nr:uncharacterized protein GSPATT00027579001 [Paramecium tetraurelia]CAK56551.1 unnamed protein product [Paramecium tetraurelia]|eukprot:XP_001423949.1 hypothetical protein (macronuclear) [Paramecium tetraurelia strain d4-2]
MSYQIEKCQIHNLDKLYINLEKNTQAFMKTECLQCIKKESISVEEILMKFKQMISMQSKVIQNQQIMVVLQKIVQSSDLALHSFQQMHKTIQDQHEKWQKIHSQFEQIQKLSKSTYYNQEELSQIVELTLNSNLTNVPSFAIAQLDNFQKLTIKLQQINEILHSNPQIAKVIPQQAAKQEEQQLLQPVQKGGTDQKKDFEQLSQFQTNITVYAIAFSFDNSKIVIGGGNYNQIQNKNLMVLNLSGDSKLQSETILYGHSKRVTAICYSKNEHFFVSGSLDSTLRLWRYEIKNQNWDCIKQLNKHTSTVLGLAISNYDNLIISCGHDSKIFIWKNSNQIWQESQTISEHIAAVNSISLSDDNHLLASGSEDTKVYIWKNENNIFSKLSQIDVPSSSFIYSVHFIKYHSLIVGTFGGNISIWQINEDNNQLCYENNPNFGYIKKIVYNQNQSLMITKCEHRTIMWKIINNEKIEQIKDQEGEYLGIGLSQGPSIIAMFNCEKKALELLQCNV